jgi:hypothetical protein
MTVTSHTPTGVIYALWIPMVIIGHLLAGFWAVRMKLILNPDLRRRAARALGCGGLVAEPPRPPARSPGSNDSLYESYFGEEEEEEEEDSDHCGCSTLASVDSGGSSGTSSSDNSGDEAQGAAVNGGGADLVQHGGSAFEAASTQLLTASIWRASMLDSKGGWGRLEASCCSMRYTYFG